MRRSQPVFGAEHIEIRLPNAHDQVLLSSFAIGLGLGHDLVGSSQIDDPVPAENRLRKIERPASGFVSRLGLERNRYNLEVAGPRRDLDKLVERARSFRIGFGPAAGCAELRQVNATRLRLGFERGQAARFRFVNSRVRLQSLLVNLEQRRGGRHARH